MIAISTAIALLAPSAALAAGAILLSSDGVSFAPTYSGVLFNGIAKFVPGDTQSEVFYVRNGGPDDGYLRLTLRDVTGSPVLINGLSVSTSVPGGPGADVELSKSQPCWVLNEGIFVAAGATVAVTASLTFDPASGNTTQNGSANFNLGVNLTDTAVVLPPTNCGGSGPLVPGTLDSGGSTTGELSYTGTEVPVMLISVAAFVIGVGLYLVVAARRRKRGADGKEIDP